MYLYVINYDAETGISSNFNDWFEIKDDESISNQDTSEFREITVELQTYRKKV